MNRCRTRFMFFLIVALLVGTSLACAIGTRGAEEEIPAVPPSITPEAITTERVAQAPLPKTETPPATPTEPSQRTDEPIPVPSHPPAGPRLDKWALRESAEGSLQNLQRGKS